MSDYRRIRLIVISVIIGVCLMIIGAILVSVIEEREGLFRTAVTARP